MNMNQKFETRKTNEGRKVSIQQNVAVRKIPLIDGSLFLLTANSNFKTKKFR